MAFEFVFDGIAEFRAGLDLLRAEAGVIAEANLVEATRIIERQAKINAHTGEHAPGEPHIPGTGPGPNKATGNLLDHIQGDDPVPVSPGVFSAEVGVTTDADYGKYLEGREGDGPYPFFESAVDSSQAEIDGVWADGYRRLLGG